MARKQASYERRSYAQQVAAVARVCRRMEGGESLADICRDPTMPRRSTFMSWLARNPELRARVEAVRAAHPEALRTYVRWSDEGAAEFLGRIEDGRGLVEVCAEADMPAHCTVTRWLNERPDFAERYRAARVAQADRLFDLAWRIACEPEPDEVAVARLKISTLKWRVGRLAPRKYGPWRAVWGTGGEGAGAGTGAGRRQDVRYEIRRFAYAPDGAKDITCLIRGMDDAAVAALKADIAAGRVRVAEEAVLADDERVEGCFILSGQEA